MPELMFARPCVDCQRLQRIGSRCTRCQRARDAQHNATHTRANRPWYAGDWDRVAREQVIREPVCRDCGATEDLTAEHIDPRNRSRGLCTLCRSCNSRRGNRVEHSA